MFCLACSLPGDLFRTHNSSCCPIGAGNVALGSSVTLPFAHRFERSVISIVLIKTRSDSFEITYEKTNGISEYLRVIGAVTGSRRSSSRSRRRSGESERVRVEPAEVEAVLARECRPAIVFVSSWNLNGPTWLAADIVLRIGSLVARSDVVFD